MALLIPLLFRLIESKFSAQCDYPLNSSKIIIMTGLQSEEIGKISCLKGALFELVSMMQIIGIRQIEKLHMCIRSPQIED